MHQRAKIYVRGPTGMVDSALVRRLRAPGFTKLLTRTRSELVLLDQRAGGGSAIKAASTPQASTPGLRGRRRTTDAGRSPVWKDPGSATPPTS